MQQAVTQQIEEIYRNDFELSRPLPQNLEHLRHISGNYLWSWLKGGAELFRDIEPALWDECEQNPRLLLKRLPELRLWQKSAEADYVQKLDEFRKQFDDYLSQRPSEHGTVTNERPAAYFCAEFGIHNSLPNYSGGLGILAGDHLKSASDLNIPLIASGCYIVTVIFARPIGHDGWQKNATRTFSNRSLRYRLLWNRTASGLCIGIHIRGREVVAQAWLASSAAFRCICWTPICLKTTR